MQYNKTEPTITQSQLTVRTMETILCHNYHILITFPSYMDRIPLVSVCLTVGISPHIHHGLSLTAAETIGLDQVHQGGRKSY